MAIPIPWQVNGNSNREGVVKAKVLKERYRVKLEFLDGWGGGGAMEIF